MSDTSLEHIGKMVKHVLNGLNLRSFLCNSPNQGVSKKLQKSMDGRPEYRNMCSLFLFVFRYV